MKIFKKKKKKRKKSTDQPGSGRRVFPALVLAHFDQNQNISGPGVSALRPKSGLGSARLGYRNMSPKGRTDLKTYYYASGARTQENPFQRSKNQ